MPVLSQVTAEAQSWAFCLHFSNYQFLSFSLGVLLKVVFAPFPSLSSFTSAPFLLSLQETVSEKWIFPLLTVSVSV